MCGSGAEDFHREIAWGGIHGRGQTRQVGEKVRRQRRIVRQIDSVQMSPIATGCAINACLFSLWMKSFERSALKQEPRVAAPARISKIKRRQQVREEFQHEKGPYRD